MRGSIVWITCFPSYLFILFHHWGCLWHFFFFFYVVAGFSEHRNDVSPIQFRTRGEYWDLSSSEGTSTWWPVFWWSQFCGVLLACICEEFLFITFTCRPEGSPVSIALGYYGSSDLYYCVEVPRCRKPKGGSHFGSGFCMHLQADQHCGCLCCGINFASNYYLMGVLYLCHASNALVVLFWLLESYKSMMGRSVWWLLIQ